MRPFGITTDRRKAPAGRSAFVVLDFLAGLMLLGVIAVLLAKGLTLHRQAAEQFADGRAATAAAERTLTALAAGGPTDAGAAVQIAGPGPNGTRWVRVTATVHGHSAVLYGLARGTGERP